MAGDMAVAEAEAVATADELAALSQLLAWADDPATRIALPRDPQLVKPLSENSPFRAILVKQCEQSLDIARRLIGSRDPDMRLAAAVLFDPIIAVGKQEELENICYNSENGRKIWEAFKLAATLFKKYENAKRKSRSKADGERSRSDKAGNLVTVIVHGTFAANEDWWREIPGQNNFWTYINSITHDCVRQGQEITWSGGHVDLPRQQGSYRFLDWWWEQGKPRLRIIAHSHGANVVWHAATLEPTLKIKTFISLGAPICIDYPLRLTQIENIRNVYSNNDWVQEAGAWVTGRRGEGRTLPDSTQVTNYHVPNRSPNVRGMRPVKHSDLHDPDVWRNNKLAALLS